MQPNKIKLFAADCAFAVFYIIELITHFSVYLLVGYFIALAWLFLGTLTDKKPKSYYGFSSKFSLYIFNTFLVVFMGWMNTFIDISQPAKKNTTSTTAPMVFLVAGVALFAISFAIKNLYVRKIVKYIGLMCACFAGTIYYNDPGSLTFITIGICIVFMVCELFTCKMVRDGSGLSNVKYFDMSIGMAFVCCFLSLGVYVSSKEYFLSLFGDFDGFLKVLAQPVEGWRFPVIAASMLILAIFFLSKDKAFQSPRYSDSYLATCLLGLSVALYALSRKGSVVGFIIVVIAILASLGIGVKILQRDKKTFNTKKTNIINMLKFDGAALGIYLIAALGVIMVTIGYTASFAVLVAGAILAAVCRRAFVGLWIADAMKWQMVMVAIAAFAASIALTDGNKAVPFLIVMIVFVIFSLLNWSISIRKGSWDNTGMVVPKVINCILLAVISLIAVN